MKVKIKNLTFQAILGVLKKERKNKQKIVVNIEFEYNYEKKQFVDYASVASVTQKILKKKKFELIEEAILHLKDKLYAKFAISNLCIEIIKPEILPNCEVSVCK